jgi:hypothetical protein
MNEFEEAEKTKKTPEEHDPAIGSADEPRNELPPIEGGLRERVRKFLNSAGQSGPGTKQELSKDRTRSLTLLIGGTVGAVLLFIGVFSAPTTPPARETSSRTAPNLGKPTAPNKTPATPGSVTPLLNADVGSNRISSDELSPADIRGTSPRVSGSDEAISPSETTQNVNPSPRVSSPQQRGAGVTGVSPGADSDPLAAYRLNNNRGAPTYSYGGTPASTANPELSANGFGAIGTAANDPRRDASATKSSIVFVRTRDSNESAVRTQPTTTPFEETSLLPPGTRLLARFEVAATTAVKTPVVASIEYNYERDGIVVVPAGSTVIGDVQQASPEGYLNIRFHTLRMPDGREEKIEGAGVALDHRPLKGEVSGKNTGRKFLSRTLSGVGSIAAYVAGAGGAGLNQTITGETLLRDRLASNIGLAGEQELLNATYSQNISVTVPANTRFYVVLQKAAATTAAPSPSRTAEPATRPAEMPTVQELRELMDLRREINRMYQESNSSSPGGTKP